MRLENGMLLLEITTACNLNCKHCFRNRLGGKDLTIAQIETIIEKITSLGVTELVLAGGEPFLREDIFEIIDIAKKYKIKAVGITTNGTLLNKPRIVDQLKKRLDVISIVMVSLLGATPKTHDFICPGGCIVVTQALKGEIFSSDPLCPFSPE